MTRCDCRISARNQTLLEKAGIPARYKNCTLANFNIEMNEISLSVRNAHRDAQRFMYRNIRWNGRATVGGADRRRQNAPGRWHDPGADSQKGVPCLFYDYRELLKEIQHSYNPSVQATEMQILRPVFEAEVLVLDELGAVKPSEWVWDTVVTF